MYCAMSPFDRDWKNPFGHLPPAFSPVRKKLIRRLNRRGIGGNGQKRRTVEWLGGGCELQLCDTFFPPSVESDEEGRRRKKGGRKKEDEKHQTKSKKKS